MVSVSLTFENRHNFTHLRGKLASFPTYIIKNLKRRFNTIDSGGVSSETNLNHSHHRHIQE
ncbi:hypothetical protein CS535_08080 [Yersinia massiliensis]|uniref:Uncharacterized protein n=1 Tax=Yersinia massiliensis TaxID=419257 RepID=A0ABM6UMW9_9GAMM|nr:hypothetical protein CRN74_18585 [Yersinia frederiksenii]AVX36272.1 hypothetical protein DA391_00490 [Yersinia massiliensis]OWF72670.1 hypothetical protein B4902_12470 [Yersinia frederiksenii]PHZ24277.1 hypothetical protein CS535_08080 [Yersinia massiliensis]